MKLYLVYLTETEFLEEKFTVVSALEDGFYIANGNSYHSISIWKESLNTITHFYLTLNPYATQVTGCFSDKSMDHARGVVLNYLIERVNKRQETLDRQTQIKESLVRAIVHKPKDGGMSR